jgi:hypothetical protein
MMSELQKRAKIQAAVAAIFREEPSNWSTLVKIVTAEIGESDANEILELPLVVIFSYITPRFLAALPGK